jgi:hypothetical protein
METRRWTNPTQPQTLQIAVFLLYFDAFVGVVYGQIFSSIGLVFVVGAVTAGFGIANEKRWGYALGIGIALLPFALRLIFRSGIIGGSLLNFMFEIALVALLLHPQSRDYQRIWFS